MSRKPSSRNRQDDATDALAALLSAGHGTVSHTSLDRLCAIPLLFDTPSGARAHHGEIMIDSWSAIPGVALRDIQEGHVRRLQLGWNDVRLDLVAERIQSGWQFVARVVRGEEVAHDYALKIGTKSLLSRSGGYFTWRSRRVPHALELLSFGQRIVFEDLAWP